MSHQPWLDDGDVVLHHGDALEQLARMPSESVQCIVTSPPFWGLRDYGTGSWSGGDEDCDHVAGMARKDGSTLRNIDAASGRRALANDYPTDDGGTVQYRNACGKCGATRVDQQIGLEETPDQWCARLVAVMREARRVLRSDGVAWLECGDTYSSGGRADDGPQNGKQQTNVGSLSRERPAPPAGIKPKDLVGAPWMLAFALRADGWYLRSDTIWARPNPMPESVTDRPTKAHSYVFLLTKSARYFYDADAIREESQVNPDNGWAHSDVTVRSYTGEDHPSLAKQTGGAAYTPSTGSHRLAPLGAGRNARSVWSIPTEPTPFSHFATFPTELVRRCIAAGTSEHGACAECGAPWRRITVDVGEYAEAKANGTWPSGGIETGMGGGKGGAPRVSRQTETTGWAPSCSCLPDWTRFGNHDLVALGGLPRAPVVPCVVLDPFMGSGTTALVARRLGRHAIGIELNASYLAISAVRLQQPTLWSTPT